MNQADPRYVDVGHRIEFTPRCWSCYDSGIILARKLETLDQPYAFLCDCDHGIKRGNTYPRWNDANKNKYVALK